MTTPPLSPTLELVAIDRADEEASKLLTWNPKAPFSLAENTWMPWSQCSIDRVMLWLPEYELERFEEGVSEEAAIECVKAAHSYSFDGELVFIPQAHASSVWRYLSFYMQAAVNGQTQFEFEGATISVEEDALFLGEGPTGLFGFPTSRGLWVMFEESDASFGTEFIHDALAAYPKNNELNFVRVGRASGLDAGMQPFDFSRAWTYQDSHLSDHLRPTRASDVETYPSFFAFLAGAIEERVISLSCLQEEVVSQPLRGEVVGLVGTMKHDDTAIFQLVRLLGGEMIKKNDDHLPSLVIAGEDAPAWPQESGITVLSENGLVQKMLGVHASAIEQEAAHRVEAANRMSANSKAY